MYHFFNSKKYGVAFAAAVFSVFGLSATSPSELTNLEHMFHPVIHAGDYTPADFSNSLPSSRNNSGRQNIRNREEVASSGYNPIEGPDGTTWYYTASFETEDIYYNEYYTDKILQSFEFKFYNNRRQHIGTVKDKIRYADNEIRDRECVVDPAVSLHFFNTDDKPEIMVYHAMNTDIYVNHYYYSVYSIGGEKDEEGYDKTITTIEGRCIEVINNSSSAREENYLYTFVLDPVVDFPADDPDYVEKLNQKVYRITTYAKAENDTDGPRVFFTKDIYSTRIPGDTTEGIYFMSKRYGGKLYFIYSQYEKPYFVDPRGGAEDESATPDNALLIEMYETSGETPEFLSLTRIPVNAEPSTDDKLIYTFLSIGSVSWTDDVDMKYTGTPDRPAFIVARDVALASDIENMKSSYYIYDVDGNLLKTIAEDTESISIFRNGDPDGPMAMFVKHDDLGNYIFVFAYLFTGEILGTINQHNNGDPLYATCYPLRIDGEYKFVFEMMYFDIDNKGNDYARVAWFGKDSAPEKIDRINIGKGAQAAMVYLSGVTLDPRLYDNDDEMEYAVLVKRTYGATVRNEYLVVDDTGGRYAMFSSDDGKGEPYMFSIIKGNPNRILVQYNGSGINYTYVDLPFTTEPVFDEEDEEEEIEEGGNEEEDNEDSGIETPHTDDGDAVYFDLQGRRIVNPDKGIYILNGKKIIR